MVPITTRMWGGGGEAPDDKEGGTSRMTGNESNRLIEGVVNSTAVNTDMCGACFDFSAGERGPRKKKDAHTRADRKDGHKPVRQDRHTHTHLQRQD